MHLEQESGKPQLMKRMNTTLIYQTLAVLGDATRAEIVEQTSLSTTTVRTLLEELLRDGEIVPLNYDQSSGGRRALRYALDADKNLILSFYLEEPYIHYRLQSLSGLVKKEGKEALPDRRAESVVRHIERICREQDLCAIGLGVPGIVDNGHYYVSSGFNLWEIDSLGVKLEEAFSLPVILENDLNSIAVGFGLRYAREHPSCPFDSINMAYIHFNEGCMGTGIISDGRIVKGANQFAGELGFLPIAPNKMIADLLVTSDRTEMEHIIARTIAVLCCVVNPSFVVIGGRKYRAMQINPDDVRSIADQYIFEKVMPLIISSDNEREDYLSGLYHLTREYILPKLPLSKESPS
ncbi:ROK family transcriptional regulator [Candidatus Soleaferrea massiliensis]|uniref:ROK family transcriptional regulator n=1 Tax=Candidatus Soleaferrea massiliensis TaxID=1470354 RepID=UPI00058D5D93|nr:ROK family protein [Candidatus Soleaferrea massiliensis]